MMLQETHRAIGNLKIVAKGRVRATRSGLVGVALALVFSGCGGLDTLRSPDETDELSQAPDRVWQLTDPFGRPVELSTRSPTRPTMLVFNDLDCGHCRQEASSVAAFSLQYAGRIDVYSVQLDRTAAAAQRFARKIPGVKSIWDPGRQFANAMNVARAPQIIFINTDGSMLIRESWLSLKIRQRAEALFEKSPRRTEAEVTGEDSPAS